MPAVLAAAAAAAAGAVGSAGAGAAVVATRAVVVVGVEAFAASAIVAVGEVDAIAAAVIDRGKRGNHPLDCRRSDAAGWYQEDDLCHSHTVRYLCPCLQNAYRFCYIAAGLHSNYQRQHFH